MSVVKKGKKSWLQRGVAKEEAAASPVNRLAVFVDDSFKGENKEEIRFSKLYGIIEAEKVCRFSRTQGVTGLGTLDTVG